MIDDQGDRRARARPVARSLTTPCGRRAGRAEDMLDWRRQAEDMAWFVACVDGSRRGRRLRRCRLAHRAGVAGHGEAFGLRSTAVAASARRSSTALAGWARRAAGNHARDECCRGRRGESRLGRPPRLSRGRPRLPTRARSGRDRGTRGRPAGRSRDRDLGGAAGRDPGHVRGRVARHIRTSPAARSRFRWTRSRAGSQRTSQGTSDRPEATFVAIARRRGCRVREALALERAARTRRSTT